MEFEEWTSWRADLEACYKERDWEQFQSNLTSIGLELKKGGI